MATDPQQPQTPTEQLQAGQDIASAGAQAAAAEPEPAKKRPAARRAIQKEAAARGWELSDDDAGRIADMVVDRIRDAGGFDHPPEPIAAPAHAPQPPAAAPSPEQPAAPAHRTFAERFRSAP
jgi:hypothetical protein